MRTKIFFFAMLASVAASAQSHINIEMLGATYTTSPTVKFRVSWSSVPTVTGQTHNAKIWVWIDFLKVNADNTTTGNTWTRAEISTTPAVSSSPASTAALDVSTDKGFWLNGVTGSYSATVTATLTNISANTKFNWCAYSSDYPPNVTLEEGAYTFKGTTDFLVSNPAQTLTTKTIVKSNLTVNSATTFTDATGCPGIGSLYCPYTGSDLYMDATHLCQQRASGAQNWEAWIKDIRDSELYRIVLMPDNTWWLAQNVKLASYNQKAIGSQYSHCNKDECGRGYTYAETIGSWGGTSGIGANIQGICSSGWHLPTIDEWKTMLKGIKNSISFTTYGGGTCGGYYFNDANVLLTIRTLNDACTNGNDHYGWANVKSRNENAKADSWRPGFDQNTLDTWISIGHIHCNGDACNYMSLANVPSQYMSSRLPVRCRRQP
jgi:uncharacterized protein (TIGR02145 family)